MPYITRITNNTNGWITPSDPNAQQQQNGFVGVNRFGFEEWWRNEMFQLAEENGEVFQYGFLQSLNVINVVPRTLDEVKLYSRVNGQNIIVAKLNNVIVLDQGEVGEVEVIEDIEANFAPGIQQIRNNLLEIGGQLAVNRFDMRPYAGEQIRRCLFNFKVNVNDIEYFGWDNGINVNVPTFFYRLILFNNNMII